MDEEEDEGAEKAVHELKWMYTKAFSWFTI